MIWQGTGQLRHADPSLCPQRWEKPLLASHDQHTGRILSKPEHPYKTLNLLAHRSYDHRRAECRPGGKLARRASVGGPTHRTTSLAICRH